MFRNVCNVKYFENAILNLTNFFQVINALLILAFIPLFDKIIYPKLAEYNLLKKPLQRLTAGGILAGVAFLVSALLELKLEVINFHPTIIVEVCKIKVIR